MPDIPENVPIYIASDHGDDDDEDDKAVSKESGESKKSMDLPTSRKSLMEDKSAGNWEPYTKEITVKESDKKSATFTTGAGSSGGKATAEAVVKKEVFVESPYVKKKTMTILLIVTAVNLLIVGIFLGNQLIPHAPITTSLSPTYENLYDNKSKIAPANVIADLVSKANPCVVNIDIRMVPKMSASSSAAATYTNPSSEMMPNQATGLIVRSDGYILTCAHAFKNFETIDVTLYNNKNLEAKLVGKDDFTDLAVIKVDAQNLPVMKFGDIKTAQPGDWVVAVGCPVGLDHTVTTGVISSTNRSLAEVNNNRVELIQHDALLYIGSSGGPLLNIKGEVIGINAAVRGGTPGISFSVPSDAAIYVTNELIAHGTIARPYMGVVMDDVDPNMTRSLTLPSNSVAVRVVRVEPKGPADMAGLKNGDLILKIKGINVVRSSEVRKLTRNDKPGQVIDILIQREGKQLPLQMELGDFAKFRPHG